MAEAETPLETPLVVPLEKRRTVRLSLDIEETIAENLPLQTKHDRSSFKSSASRMSFKSSASIRSCKSNGSRVSFLGATVEEYDPQTSAVSPKDGDKSPFLRPRASLGAGSRRGSARTSLVIDTGPLSIHSACPSLMTFNSQATENQVWEAKKSTASRPSAASDEGLQNSMTQSYDQGGILGTCKHMLHTPQVRACRHMLLPWVKWIPIEIAVLLLLVTPPFVVFLFNAVTGQYIYLFGTKDWTEVLFPLTGWSQFVYLALRVFATGFDRQELGVFIIWSLWLTLFHVKSVFGSTFRRTVGIVLCAGMLVTYAWRVVLLGREIRRISRQLVSKKKRRFVHLRCGFDLDLSYITRSIIAMGFPSQYTVEAQFRNPMEEVQRFFETRHSGHYKVYNLCSERTYTHRCFDNEFHDVRFPDHNPCPLAKLIIICNDMQDFLASNRAQNIVAVHCKAGKGRTGLIVSSFLLHSRKCRTAKEALERFGDRRTFNGKGVTIPSQIRYVHHYETLVRERQLRGPTWFRLWRLESDVSFPEDCRFQVLSHEEGLEFDSCAALRSSATSADRSSALHRTEPPLLEGDVKIVVFRGTTKLFHFWFHTAYDPSFVQNSPKAMDVQPTPIWQSSEERPRGPIWEFALPKHQLDGLHKDKDNKPDAKKISWLPSDFKIRMIFGKPSWEEEHEALVTRQRDRAKRENEDGRRKTLSVSNRRSTNNSIRSKGSTASIGSRLDKAVDYDEMGNDTDEEEMLSTLYRGYLLRSAGCQRRQRRWCEVSTCGKLHIAGRNVLVVDIAEGDKVCQPLRGKEYAWRVRNPTNGTWEHLEVEEGSDEKQWDQAFADCMRLGDAIRDIHTFFCGFFWKLNHDADEELIRDAFEFTDWRVRLFVMRDSGQVVTYSWKDKTEKVFADFSSPLHDVQKMRFSWQNMPHTVPFQILRAGEEPTFLAAKEEDFLAFEAKVLRLRANLGISRADSFPVAQTLQASTTTDRTFDTAHEGSIVLTQW